MTHVTCTDDRFWRSTAPPRQNRAFSSRHEAGSSAGMCAPRAPRPPVRSAIHASPADGATRAASSKRAISTKSCSRNSRLSWRAPPRASGLYRASWRVSFGRSSAAGSALTVSCACTAMAAFSIASSGSRARAAASARPVAAAAWLTPLRVSSTACCLRFRCASGGSTCLCASLLPRLRRTSRARRTRGIRALCLCIASLPRSSALGDRARALRRRHLRAALWRRAARRARRPGREEEAEVIRAAPGM